MSETIKTYDTSITRRKAHPTQPYEYLEATIPQLPDNEVFEAGRQLDEQLAKWADAQPAGAAHEGKERGEERPPADRGGDKSKGSDGEDVRVVISGIIRKLPEKDTTKKGTEYCKLFIISDKGNDFSAKVYGKQVEPAFNHFRKGDKIKVDGVHKEYKGAPYLEIASVLEPSLADTADNAPPPADDDEMPF